MNNQTLIYVEGDEDERFLKSYIEFLNHPCNGFKIKSTEGKNNLGGSKVDIQNALNIDSRVLIVFDADENYEKAATYIKKILDGLDVKIFLFPNNESLGALENLLEQIIKSEHQDIFNCFEDYQKCLKGKNKSYEYPNLKAKIYSYKEALKILEEKRQFNRKCWDFDNSCLEPLKDFLKKNL